MASGAAQQQGKIILAYSGGLDTSVMVPWIKERYGYGVVAFKESPYSIDQNLWGRSCEAGVLEDPWDEPPEEAFVWTTDPRKASNEPEYVEVDFRHGVPVALNGKEMDGVPLI